VDRAPRVVMLVSPQGGEGKTAVAIQFASALVHERGLRVLLVDAHARRPALSADLSGGAPPGERSGSEPGEPAPESVAGRLRVLPLTEENVRLGVLPPQALRDLLEAVAGDFDWVILDGPSVLETPESASLAAVADGVVIVLHGGRTKRPVLLRAVDLLRKSGGHVLGTVLNRRRLEIPGFIYRRI
jgi:Mrp family chromosome partitioning ATPase